MELHHLEHHREMAQDFRRRFWISTLLTIPVLLLSAPFMELIGTSAPDFPGRLTIQILIGTGIFLYGGYPFLEGAYSELNKQTPGMMTLVALAISVAYGFSLAVFFGFPGSTILWEVATLIDVMLLGHWLEMKSVIGASRALEKLANLMPSTAHKVEGDALREVDISELEPGDQVRVKAGERLPADGTITEGTSSLDESMLTGESKPVTKTKGDSVIGGAVNGDGVLTVQVTQSGDQSYLSQVMNLVHEAQAEKSQTQTFADQAAFWLTIIAVLAGLLTFISWTVWSTQPIPFIIERTITVIVIACPHALGLAIPLVTSISTSTSARQGILTRNRTTFERAYRTQAVVFDKTGTLTYGNFQVSEIHSLDTSVTKEEVLHLAASLEAHSEHPIGQAIASEEEKVSSVTSVETIPGFGIQGTIRNESLKAVSPAYLRMHGIDIPQEASSDAGRTVTYILKDNTPIGRITLEDRIRPESSEAVRALQKRGIAVVLLTGDQREVAERVAEELHISQVLSEVLPDEKTQKIKELKHTYTHVTMVGDGINDAPALATADLGIAIGAGTDVAVETADLVLVNNDPQDVVKALDLSRRTRSKMVQNLWWAAGYNIVALPLAAGIGYSAGIILSPAVGGILMSLSTIIVALNAMLLRKRVHS